MAVKMPLRGLGQRAAIRSQGEGQDQRALHVSGLQQSVLDGQTARLRKEEVGDPWLCCSIRLKVPGTEELYLVYFLKSLPMPNRMPSLLPLPKAHVCSLKF